MTLLSLGAVHDRLGDFLVAGAALGTAYGFAFASLGGLVVDAVPAEQTGAATGVNTIFRTIGGAAGAQLATAIVTGSAGGGSTVPTESGYSTAFYAAAVAAAAALLISVGVRGGGRSPARRTARLVHTSRAGEPRGHCRRHGSCVRHSRTHPGSDDKYRVRPSSGGRKRRLGETG